MKARMKSDGGENPSGAHAEPAHGTLSIGGGTAFASASNPSAEVIKGTGVTNGKAFPAAATTLDLTNGTIRAGREGDFDVELNLADFSCQAASGNVQFDVQYAPDGTTFAAFGTGASDGGSGRMQAIRVAATAKGGLIIRKRQTLVKGGKVRAIVTSAAGNIITVTEGQLSLTQVCDPLTGVAEI